MRAAGQLALAHFGRVKVERKADKSLVTEADRAVERFLVGELAKIVPDARVLGEEATTALEPSDARPTWAIDPIDGTAAFVAALSTWSISVGLIDEGEPTLGCVYLPVSNEMFLAGSSGPLYWNGEPVRRAAEPGMLGDASDPETWIAVPSNYHKRYQTTYRGKLRSLGSTAAHLAWTARGAAAGSLGFVRLWDAAGGLACCRAAGVAFSYLSGLPIVFKDLLEGQCTPEPLVAAHPDDIGLLREAFSLKP